jgi:hypothetical protein
MLDEEAEESTDDEEYERAWVKYRMYLNGENEMQMKHVKDMKQAGGVSPDSRAGNDTSKTQEWDIDDSPSALRKDKYVLITTIIWMGVKLIVFTIPTLVLAFPPMFIARCYISVIPPLTEHIPRTICFWVCFVVAAIHALPVCILAVLLLLLDNIFYYFFSFMYCACTCRWADAMKSREKVRPYSNGPSIITHLPDFFVCCMGQCARQSIGETWYMVSCMLLLIPWLKYYVCCNPWIYDLDHRLVQQISTEMQDLGKLEDVSKQARRIISRAKQLRQVAERIDIWNFVPHYPYPPPHRRWALGLQAGGSNYPGKFTLIVHTTHFDSEVCGCDPDDISDYHFVLSNCVDRPIYRVMLWYSNPYHFLTGWVEASVSNGLPSQPEKRHGGEHPMWLVTGKTPLTAGRDSWTGSGMIDAFFDYWLPAFVHEMRRLTWYDRFIAEGENDSDAEELSLERADSRYQEVGWSDRLVSEPNLNQGRDAYMGQDILTAFADVADAQNKHITREVARGIDGVAERPAFVYVNELQGRGPVIEIKNPFLAAPPSPSVISPSANASK